MTDLTKIEKPFALLDEATQRALKEHKGVIEFFGYNGWTLTDDPSWSKTTAYRAKAEPPKPVSEMQDGWCRTTALRYYRRPVFGLTRNLWPSVLQQQWVTSSGQVEWRDVETVEEGQ